MCQPKVCTQSSSSPSPPAPMNPPIDSDNLKKSISALLKWQNIQTHQTDNTDNFLYLVITLKKVLAKPLQSLPHKIPLPHPLLPPSPSICLIIPDPPKSPNKLTLDHLAKTIKSQNINISKVLKLSKLRSLCKTPACRQNFLDEYDVVMADERVVKIVGGVMGKKKGPVPVCLKGGLGLKEEVERACCCQVLRFGSGTCHSVRVGESLMEGAEIVENAVAGIRGVVEFVPKKWKGVAAMHLKFSESLAMPIYGKDRESVSGEGEMKMKVKVKVR